MQANHYTLELEASVTISFRSVGEYDFFHLAHEISLLHSRDRPPRARFLGNNMLDGPNAFRENLRQSWTRRAIRMLTITRPTPYLASLSSNTVVSLRDRECGGTRVLLS